MAGMTARIRHQETKLDVVVAASANLAATVTDSSLAIYVGNSVSIVNHVYLRETLQRMFNMLKDEGFHAKPAASTYRAAYGPLGATYDNISVADQAGTYGPNDECAVVYGPDFDHMPGGSGFLQARFSNIIDVMQERAWARP